MSIRHRALSLLDLLLQDYIGRDLSLWKLIRIFVAMKVVIAIDSLKGCLTSRQANEAAREAVLRRWPDAEVVCLPMSDGGDGFLDAVAPLLSPRNGGCKYQRITVNVFDPLMRPIQAQYLLSEGRAFIEMAQASGLGLLKPEERNPLRASSYGTGQLIADALRRGAQEIVVGLGGSATSDCGMGMMEALQPPPAPSQGGGVNSPGDAPSGLYSSNTSSLGKGVNSQGDAPSVLYSSNTPSLGGGRGRSYPSSLTPSFGGGRGRFLLATDVTNPLLGEQGAARTFARQKANPDMTPAELDAMVEELESRASAFAAESAARLGHDCSGEAGAGAAGGVGYALMQYLGARRVSGIDFVLDLANFDSHLPDADLIITGEGRADRQTLMGKVPMGILQRTKAFIASLPNQPHSLHHSITSSLPHSSAPAVVLLAGQVADREALLQAGFAHVVAITPASMPLSMALQPQVARHNIIETIKHINL